MSSFVGLSNALFDFKELKCAIFLGMHIIHHYTSMENTSMHFYTKDFFL